MSEIYRLAQFAKRVGCGASSLRLWDKNGKFPARKTATGQRYYDESDVRRFLNLSAKVETRVVCYSRVSSNNQKPDLINQVKVLEDFCVGKGIQVDEWVTEIGGGMNFKRKKFLQITDDISLGKVSKLILAHKDRWARFGFDYFQHLCDVNGCEVIILNQETLSPQEEMVEDLMSIVHTFSCRLYGLRNYKTQLKKALK